MGEPGEYAQSTRMTYQSSGHMRPQNVWTLTLNRYQRDNLLAFIEAAMSRDDRPVGSWNNGDWIGEVTWMLGKTYYDEAEKREVTSYVIDGDDRPNHPLGA